MAKTILEAGYPTGLVTTANTTQYSFLIGSHTSYGTTETGLQSIFHLTGTLSGLYVRITANSIAGNSTIRTRLNGANGGQSVSIGSSATGAFEDASGTDTLADTDKICVQSVPGASTGTLTISLYSTLFDATTNTVTKFSTNIVASAASTTYFVVPHGDVGITTTEASAKLRMRKAGTMKKGSVLVATARATTSTIKSRKNGADGGISISLTGGTTGWLEDSSGTDTIAAGNDWNWTAISGTGVDTPGWRAQVDFESTSGDGILAASDARGVAITEPTTNYFVLGGRLIANTTSTNRGTKARDTFDCSELVTLVTANGITSASTIALNVNGTDSALIASITASTTGLFLDSTHTASVVATDDLMYRMVTPAVGGTPSVTITYVSMSIHETGVGVLYPRSLPTETVTISESLTRLAAYPRTMTTETTTIGETIARVATNSRLLTTETTTIGETLARQYGATRTIPTETISISESSAVVRTLARALATEIVTIGELLARAFNGQRLLATETTAISETLTTLKTIVRPLATETVAIGETLARTLGLNRALATQTTTIGEILARLYSATRTIPTETTTISENVVILKTIVRALATETVTIGESLVRAFNGVRLLPAETVTVGTGTLARLISFSRALATETVAIGGESLTRLYSSMRALATETVTITGGTVARMLSASRTLAAETVTVGETLARQFIGIRLLAAQTTAISDSIAMLYTPAPPAGTFERQMPLENVAITESLNRVVTNSRTLPEITAISESTTRVYGTVRTIATQTVPITESLVRMYGSTRALPTQVVNIAETQSRLCNTARTLLPEITPITESLARRYGGTRTLSTETVAISESLVILITPVVIIPSIWRITGQNTDFPDSLENLITEFIKSNWSITEPIVGLSPTTQAQIDNFAYDTYRTYYVRVKEVGSEVKNRQIHLNTYEFETPIELELFSRRLKKGEAFLQLNNMMNELMRIFGTCDIGTDTGQLFGIEGVTLDRITSMEKERSPSQTTWSRKLRITLIYYKISIVG